VCFATGSIVVRHSGTVGNVIAMALHESSLVNLFRLFVHHQESCSLSAHTPRNYRPFAHKSTIELMPEVLSTDSVRDS
jgi:hypothetical protein